MARAELVMPAAGMFQHASRGVTTCVGYLDDPTHGFCLVAYQALDGTTRIVMEELEGVLPIRIVDVTAENAISFVYEPRLSIDLNATVDGVGDIALRTITDFGGGRIGANDGCILYPYHIDLWSTTPSIYATLRTEGTIAGRVVRGNSRCGYFFLDDTSGVWRFAYGA